MFAHLAVLRLPIQIAEAFNPALSIGHTSVLVLLVDRGLNWLLGTLPRDHLTNILHMILLSLSEEQCWAYYGSDQMVEEIPQHPENGILQPGAADPHSPRPTRDSSPTDSLSLTDTAVNPLPQLAQHTNLSLDALEPHPAFPQGNDIVTMLH